MPRAPKCSANFGQVALSVSVGAADGGERNYFLKSRGLAESALPGNAQSLRDPRLELYISMRSAYNRVSGRIQRSVGRPELPFRAHCP